MMTKLHLERFKNFQDAELFLGPFTLLVGANASGKSNVRDAFRFLHGIGRGYSLAEIFGEKWGEGGEIQWHGIRGGTREACFQGAATFALAFSFTVPSSPIGEVGYYRLEVDPGVDGNLPRVIAERLIVTGHRIYTYDSAPPNGSRQQSDPDSLA